MVTERDYELLSAYFDGALTESERAAFESRLTVEPDLRRELEALRATVTLLRALPARRSPRNFTLTPAQVRPRSPRWLLFPATPAFSALSAAAAVILFALSAGLFSGALSIGRSQTAAPADAVAFQSTLGVSPARTATVLKSAEAESEEPAVLTAPLATGTPAAVMGESAEVFAAAPPQLTAVAPDQSAQSNLAAPAEDRQMVQGTMLPAASPEAAADALQPGAAAVMAAPAQSGAGGADSAAGITVERAAETVTPTPAPSRAPTVTSQFRPSMTPSVTPQPPDASPTVISPPMPSVPESAAPGRDWLPLVMLLAGLALMVLAVITTVVRRRSR